MLSRTGKSLLADEREAVLMRALQSMSHREFECAAIIGIDARQILGMMLDMAVAQDEDEVSSAREGFVDVARLLSRHDLSWNAVEGLSHALIISAFETLDSANRRLSLSLISSGLLHAQLLLFEAYMDAEEKRRERIAEQLREVDRFPDTIAATLDPPTLTKIGLARLKDILHMGDATMCEIDASRRLIPVMGDPDRKSRIHPGLELNGAAATTLFIEKEPYWEVRGKDNLFLAEGMERRDAGCVILLPMVVRGRTTGVIILTAGPPKSTFNPDEIELAGRFASRLAVALENAYLHEREQRKIKETVALLEITRAINSTLDLGQILEKVVQMTVDLCGVVMCVIYLRADGEERFEPAAYHGFIEEVLWEGDGAGFAADGMRSAHVETLEKGETVVLPVSGAGCLLSCDILCEHGVDTVFLFPLKAKEKLSGVFALFYPCREAGGLEAEEIEVVRAIAAQASMAIENAALYEDIERSYFSTVRALAKAIEVKDPYTHGHSERVTDYALMIAEAMNLEEREKQKLKYAATLHDIGKIGIAGRVLNKPDSLTSEEYAHVKTHPILGESIVEPVEFLQGPRPIILHHHEHYDGSGYPHGLKGSGIPLCARILSVADAFEAMRSDRPYRRALPLQKATGELKRNAGSQFDPEVVRIFIEILERCGGDPINR